MADLRLETERLELRPPAADDLPWMLEAMNTLAVMRHLGGAIRSPAEVAESLESDIAAFDSGGHRRWTVWLRGSERRIGRCGLFFVRSAAAPDALRGQQEVGWTFAEPFWGQGYATEAARAVIGCGFAQPSRAEIFAQTSDSNAASTRMMARLGFDRCSSLDYIDPDYPPLDNPTTVYRLTRDAWNAQ